MQTRQAAVAIALRLLDGRISKEVGRGTRVERVLSSLTPQCPERRRASAGAQGSVGRAATYPPPATIEWLLNGG